MFEIFEQKKVIPKNSCIFTNHRASKKKLWMIEKCIKVLKKRKEIDTAFMVKKFYKNLWKKIKKIILEQQMKNMDSQDKKKINILGKIPVWLVQQDQVLFLKDQESEKNFSCFL